MSAAWSRRLPGGAEILPGGGVEFRAWAPRAGGVRVVLDPGGAERSVALGGEPGGWFAARVDNAGAGTRYGFRLGDDPQVLPDPVSRFQPAGPHGPSEVVDPGAFRWTDGAWTGLAPEDAVVYEMHLGTFTPEGTLRAAEQELPELAAAGVTVIELMPVAEFPGRFGWGYDGVDLYAPAHVYGTPDDLRRFVDRAHAAGLAVLLDVVYNHLGPDGNYLARFAPEYFSTRHTSEWGATFNFDGPRCAAVRELIVGNAGYWIDEFHVDGLRLDATQSIFDWSGEHVLAAIARRVRERAGARRTWIVAENESQVARLARPAEAGGFGLDALWNDDFHHSAMVALTGRREAYYTDYRGSAAELVAALKWGTLYQGQWYAWQEKRRGTPALDLGCTRFVNYLENHDQVSNRAPGERLAQLAAPALVRALTALLLLAPQAPLLFQGQEFGSTRPFFYFADHEPELARRVREGRAEFLSQFPSVAAGWRDRVPDPADPATFAASKLDLGERARHRAIYDLHRDLLRLRREDPAFRASGGRTGFDGAVLGARAFVLRWFHPRGDRLMVVNFGADLPSAPVPEPLLAPPADADWELLWSSEDARYGGAGTPAPDPRRGAPPLAGHAALVFRPRPDAA